MKKLLTILLLACIFTGCKKGTDSNRTPPRVTEQKLLLSENVFIDAQKKDTITIEKYKYDDKNRIIHVDAFLQSSNNLFESTDYTYDINDNLVKIVDNSKSLVNGSNETVTLTGNINYVNSVPASEDLSSNGQIQNINYITAGNQIIGEVDSATNNYLYKYTYEGTNIKTKVTYTYDNNVMYTDTTTYIYNDKKSEYFYSGYKWFLNDVGLEGQNAVIEIDNTTDGKYISTYTYNGDGYPVQDINSLSTISYYFYIKAK